MQCQPLRLAKIPTLERLLLQVLESLGVVLPVPAFHRESTSKD